MQSVPESLVALVVWNGVVFFCLVIFVKRITARICNKLQC
jgi:hypothetical protein